MLLADGKDSLSVDRGSTVGGCSTRRRPMATGKAQQVEVCAGCEIRVQDKTSEKAGLQTQELKFCLAEQSSHSGKEHEVQSPGN